MIAAIQKRRVDEICFVLLRSDLRSNEISTIKKMMCSSWKLLELFKNLYDEGNNQALFQGLISFDKISIGV